MGFKTGSSVPIRFASKAGMCLIPVSYTHLGLQNLPSDVYEAAALDGANGWQILWRITFPLLRRTTVFITTVAFIDAFRTVDHIFVLTGGGPSFASTVLLFDLWLERFENQNIGVSAAITVIFVIVLLVFTVTNFLVSEQREK